MLTRTLLLTAFAVALAAAPAQASVVDQDLMQPGMARSLITYNGHAGLGASVYQHNQTELDFARVTAITDGTSNTIMFGERAAP